MQVDVLIQSRQDLKDLKMVVERKGNNADFRRLCSCMRTTVPRIQETFRVAGWQPIIRQNSYKNKKDERALVLLSVKAKRSGLLVILLS